MIHGKKKAVTFSYDDGVYQDIRLIQMLDRYGLKATFNLNSQLYGEKGEDIRRGAYIRADRLEKKDIKKVYANHEVAAHTLTHPNLTEVSEAEIVRQVEEDRKNLENLLEREIVGLAYPGGGINYNSHVAGVIRQQCHVQYARTTVTTDSFSRQENLYEFKPNVYHTMEPERLMELGRQFLETDVDEDSILYIWGHSFELDIRNAWSVIEEFFRLISRKDDIYYGTNRDVLL
ncbi:MAG: polysaccharide deacetylase family protein [Hespellia sp.]|nr:polysaccharide deacetylase family protein [Hespellia sp.]